MSKWTFLTAMVSVLVLSGVALACPNCAESVANSDATNAEALPAGFNLSIYAMLLGFFGVLGLVVRTIVKGVRTA